MNTARTRAALACAACTALAVPAIALAANPVRGGQYANQATLSFATVSKDGKSASLTVYAGKCNSGLPLFSTKPAKISRGKLTYNGTGKFGKVNAKLTVNGKFLTSQQLKWTAHIKDGSCTYTDTETLTLYKS
jgi:hypothetical protein